MTLCITIGALLSQTHFAYAEISSDDDAVANQTIGKEIRIDQAKELLGSRYSQSVVKDGEKFNEVKTFIYQWVQEDLQGRWKKKYKQVARTIIEESQLRELDPVFLVSVIENESSFRVDAKGGAGEIGLMQLKPDTAKWITHRYHIPWHGKKTLLNPVSNIRIGAAYLDFLRQKFDYHGQLYLAAYNMGQVSVKRALKRRVWPKEYPYHVMQHYLEYYGKLREAIRDREPASDEDQKPVLLASNHSGKRKAHPLPKKRLARHRRSHSNSIASSRNLPEEDLISNIAPHEEVTD